MKTKTLLVTVALLALAGSLTHAQTLGEALDAPQLTWTTGGSAPWFGQTGTTHDSVDAAQSGALTSSYQSSWLQTTVTGRVAVAFWWKLDNADTRYHTFYLQTNNNYATYWLGVHDWSPGCVIFDSGINHVYWVYNNSGSDPSTWGGNRAWLDEVLVTNVAGLKPTILAPPPSAVTALEYAYLQTNLTALVVGDIPMTYQWQRNGTNLNEGWPFSRVTSPSLDLYPRTEAESGGAYRLVASNEWGMVTSSVCTVSIVPSKPFVHPQTPYDSLIAVGEYYSVSASVYGTPPFGYQWHKSGNLIPGATMNYYSFNSAALADTGGYSVVVTNTYGAHTSRVAQVIVSTDPPHIVYGPNPQQSEVLPGEYPYFEVSADGPQRLTFQWRKVGTYVDLGEWSSSSHPYGWLNLSAVDPTNSGLYYSIVTNNNGAVTSRVSVLAVSPVTALGVALDTPQLTVTNNATGWPVWEVDVSGTNAHDGLCAARSPDISFGEAAAFSSAVTGPTNVSFWWRISAGAQSYLDVSVDGSVSNTISGETLWQQQALALPAGEHTLTWTYRKEEWGNSEHAAWVDQLVIGGAPSAGTEITAFATSGDAPPWYLQTTNTHDGVEAWQSGAIADYETNRLTATATGPGTLTFWWQVESEEGCDFLEFWLDGVPQASISGQTNWHQQTYVLGPGSHSLEWLYDKDGSVDQGADAGWVDDVFFTSTGTEEPTLNNAVDAPSLTFENAPYSAAPWFYQTAETHDGEDAAQSPLIAGGLKTAFRTHVNGPGTLSFWCKVSTVEANPFDIFVDGEQRNRLSGEVDWHQQTHQIVAGLHTVEWSYVRMNSQIGSENDAVWVDQITFTPLPATLEAALNVTNLTFFTGGDAPWWIESTNTHDGIMALQSGAIGNNQASWLRTTVTGPGQLTYWYAISTEVSSDYLSLPGGAGITSGGAP